MGLKIWCEIGSRTHDFTGYPLQLSFCIFILSLGDYRLIIFYMFDFDFNFGLPNQISLYPSKLPSGSSVEPLIYSYRATLWPLWVEYSQFVLRTFIKFLQIIVPN